MNLVEKDISADEHRPTRSWLILFACVPGAFFWINLYLWFNEWFKDHHGGEDYDVIRVFLVIFGLSVIFFIVSFVGSVVTCFIKTQVKNRILWLIAALINSSPLMFFLISRFL